MTVPRWVGAAALLATPLAGQTTLEGTVSDSTGRPLPGVRVVLDSGRAVRSDEAGAFVLAGVAAGPHVLRFERVGLRARYLRVEVPAAAPAVLDVGVIPLDALVTELEEIVVRAPRYEQNIPGHRDLQQLQRAGFGHLLTAEEIDRLNPRDMRDLLRRMPGVNVGGSLISFVGGGQLSCPRGAAFIVDGVRGFNLNFFTDPERQIKSIWTFRGVFERCGVVVVETNPVAVGGGSPVEVGVRAAATRRSNGLAYDRVGIYLSIPVSRHVEFYPVAEARVGDRTGWNGQLAFRVVPRPETFPAYLGGGLAVGKDDGAGPLPSGVDVRADPLLFLGVSLPAGVLRITAEFQYRNLTDAARRRVALAMGAGVRIGS